eukprot:snap_masked-scaffold_55-processed-gene-1.20-mRNA-1 protein AED:1.00 eAED:1.00 QI:0/0/0/0/1/1/2/0/452
MKFENETSCDNPYIGRLTTGAIFYNKVYICSGLLLILLTAFLAFKGRKTFFQRKTERMFFIFQCIFAAFYLCFSLMFVIDEASRLTSCSASIFFQMCYHMVPVPTDAGLFCLIARSKYNTKLIEHFKSQDFFISPLTVSKEQHPLTWDSQSTSSRELQKLKYLSSEKFYCLFAFIFWSIKGLIIFIFDLIVCKGWLTGNKCAFEEMGILVLQTSLLIFSILAGLRIFSALLKHNNYLEVKSMPNHWKIALSLGILPGILFPALQIVYDIFLYEPSDEIYPFPFILADINFFCLFFCMFYPIFLLPFKNKSLNSRLVSDGLTLQDILNNPSSSALFQAFLVETLCVENLLFIQHVERFQNLGSSQTATFAQIIFMKFVAEGSVGQINLPSRVRNQIKERIEFNNIFKEMFDEAEHEVILLLTYDSLPKFRASEYYSQIIHHYLDISMFVEKTH